LLSPELCQLLAYWRSLGCKDGAPDRALLDLRQLTGLLPWMFILEMSEDGSLRYRLVGPSLEEAVGCGMAGKAYADIFANDEQASVMEELYATSLVQSSGLVRTGVFSLDAVDRFDMEVLALPFSDTRAMGGTILVGMVRPFDVLNQGFLDRWGSLRQDIASLMVIPAPRVLTLAHLSGRLRSALDAMNLDLRGLDIDATLELFRRSGGMPDEADIPSVSLDRLEGDRSQALN
jgi:hypothetical protein